jgi:hypothetical protein
MTGAAGMTGAARAGSGGASSLASRSFSGSTSSSLALPDGDCAGLEAGCARLVVRGSLGIRASTGASTGRSVNG